MAAADKPLVWLRGEVKTPPFSAAARLEAGTLLRRLQGGEKLSMPHSRPMPVIGRAATSCAWSMRRRRGASCTALIRMPS